MAENNNPYRPPKADLGNEEMRDPMVRPRSVDIAVVLIGINVLLTLLRLPALVRAMNEGAVSGVFFLGQIIGLGLWIWIGFAIFRGRNWARILMLILTVLGMIAVGLSLRSTRLFDRLAYVEPEWFLMAALPWALNLAAIYLVFVPGRAWFAKRLF